MLQPAAEQALENVYSSLHNDNEGMDRHIAELKAAIAPEKSVTIDPSRLPCNNRQGRKLMQSYFKRRGLNVVFSS